MLDPDDLINYELIFPGAVTGSTEVECPHCGELLNVPVNDPMGEESYQRGIAEAKRGDFARAKRTLEVALIHDDEHYPARVALSELLLRDKDYTGAIRHLERAVALDSTRVEARLHLARTYRKIGRNALDVT